MIDLLRYPLPGAVAFSTRRGASDKDAPYDGFNASPFSGDTPLHTGRCLRLLADELHLSATRILIPHQTHSTRVLRVDAASTPPDLEGVDALTSCEPGLCLCVSTADCIPLLLLDPRQGAAAAIHAGWRGTVGRIVEKTIESMERDYATRPEDLRAVVGPGIGPEAFEVGDEVYEAFRAAGFEMKALARRLDKWHIDLPEANRQQLLSKGIDRRNILSTRLCTYTRHDEFFSARRLGIHSGRILTGILTPSPLASWHLPRQES